jgi:hypothetical protein
MNYFIKSLPDPFQTTLQLRFGDVKKTIFSGWKSLLRMISEMEPGSISVSLCFYYSPSLKDGVQGRLKLWIKVITENKELADALILNGPIAEFFFSDYKKDAQTTPEIPWDKFNSVSEIIRRIDLISSYVPPEENKRVPSSPYQSILPFAANDDNDYMNLDRLLSGMKSDVYFEVTVKPTQTESDLQKIYAGIFNLASINEGVYIDNPDIDDAYRKDHGFMKDHFAEELLREYEEVAKNLRQPQLEFYIRIFGNNSEEVKLLASNIAETSFNEGKYRIILVEKRSEVFEKIKSLTESSETDFDWQHSQKVNKAIRKLSRVGSVDEISGIFRMPVSSNVSPKTIRKYTDPKIIGSDKHGKKISSLLIGDDVETGDLSERNLTGSLENLFDTSSLNSIEHRLPLELLKKHMFICGVPGSGKTTAIFNILVQLHRFNIPFFVIEPAKTEYRILKTLREHKSDPVLKNLGERLRIYTPGNERVSPFRFNPFAFPEGITLDEHLNNLMNCFKSAMNIPNDSPLPALLSKAVEEVYENYEEDDFPYMEDLVVKVKELMDSPDLAYDSEIKGNLKTAIEVRLSPLVSKKRSIGKIFSKDDHTPSIRSLMENPTIIEMDSLDTEQANLLTLFLLTSMREYIKTSRRSGAKLTHAVVLEEAHNVVANIPEGADPDDPRKKAADYVSRMLAELRAMGEGIIIGDQLPSTVASTVIKNTGTKLAHRLTSMDDREEIGYTMLLGGTEIEEFARLQVGEAFYYSEGLYRPRRVRCINSNEFLGFYDPITEESKQPPDNGQLYDLIEPDEWFRRIAVKNLENDMVDFKVYLKNSHELLKNTKQELLELLDATTIKSSAKKIQVKKGEEENLRVGLLNLYESLGNDLGTLENSKEVIQNFKDRIELFDFNYALFDDKFNEFGHLHEEIIEDYFLVYKRVENYFETIFNGDKNE